MAGECGAIIEYGEFRTPCLCDRFEALSQPGQLDVPCNRCLHPLSQHGSTSLVDVQPEINSITPLQKRKADLAEVPIPNFIYPRPDMVQKLADLIDRESIVQVRGTPSSGKTTLSVLLWNYYTDRKKNVCWIRVWEELSRYGPESAEPVDLLTQMLHKRNAGPADHIVPGTIVLVDEAQISYSDSDFWNSIIKEFCLFSLYGSPSTGVECVDYTPARFNPHQCVTLTTQPNGPPLALFFSKDEAYKAMDQMATYDHRLAPNTTFDNDAKDYLFSLTNGQPGGIKSLVDFIIADKVWDCLDHLKAPVMRSFPAGEKLTEGARETLACVLENGGIQKHEKPYKDLELCYRQGWLHRTIKTDRTSPEVYVLPSRLHEKQDSLVIYLGERRPLPSQFQSLQGLAMTILRGFSSTALRNSSEGKILSSGASYRPVDAQYQDEFYRGFNKVAGRGVPICSEWSRTSHGRIDFWIPEKRWAIELLRDYDRMDEHIARFRKGGKYYNWITESMVSDWIIINCAISMPKKG
ncbi:hypothetical protein BJX63DRAFT_418354 [Aspergillus granulosus]|uniref:AAA+ ATPase domain-containing protein n=1 Tax=Aspergillus granulosus TaxID=176169 RepID=A0ABR4HZ09_9EURO